MNLAKKDIATFILLTLAMIVCVRYFYRDMADERRVAAIDPYLSLIATPTAILSISNPPMFKEYMLPARSMRQAIEAYTSPIFLSLIGQNPHLSTFLIGYYPKGDILYAPMDSHSARQAFKWLDSAFAFSPRQQQEGTISVRYYPDTGSRFLGCYYHEGLFVASYDRDLLLKTIKRQIGKPVTVIPELATLPTKSKRAGINLFACSDSLDLHVATTDSTVWRLPAQWLTLNLLYDKGQLRCYNEQPYEEGIDSLYLSLSDTIENKLRQLFPELKTAVQVSHDESAAYFLIRAY